MSKQVSRTTTGFMQGKRIPLANPIFDEEMLEAAISALRNERFVGGESVHKFEEEFARYCGTRFAVSTASGTAALALSLVALGVRGGQVLTTPASFVATANSIIHADATPKFADISTRDYTLDPNCVRRSIGKETKAILPVHLYGHPAEMDQLREIASERGILLVEDACQAHGASYKGKKVGALGDVGCFSFFPSKNMTVAGDGGMLVTNDESIVESVASLRDCGRAKGSKYFHGRIGFTERLNTVQAAVGRVQLRRLDAWNESRRKIASYYDQAFSDLDELLTPPRASAIVNPVYHLYVIRCQRRDDLRTWLDQAGIESGMHYPNPIHLQPIYRAMYGYIGGEFPISEKLSRDVVSIPMHPSLTTDEIQFVSKTIREFYQSENQASTR